MTHPGYPIEVQIQVLGEGRKAQTASVSPDKPVGGRVPPMRVKSAREHGDGPVATRRYDSLSSSGEFEGLRSVSVWGLALA